MLYSVLVSIIVSVKIHDGVVMAADSATTFSARTVKLGRFTRMRTRS